MELLTADYVILAATLGAGILGLFLGFSGALAFLAGTVVAALAGRFAWDPLAGWLADGVCRALAELVLVLLAFGLVRWIVKKTVNGLLKQPADAIFGFLVAAFTGFALVVAVVLALGFLNWASIDSALVARVSEALGVLA